jgi:hypothetical protein
MINNYFIDKGLCRYVVDYLQRSNHHLEIVILYAIDDLIKQHPQLLCRKLVENLLYNNKSKGGQIDNCYFVYYPNLQQSSK